jgi:hypothetical protein
MEFQKRNRKRDLEIVFLRENKKWIFKEIAKKYGVTPARARQLYTRVVRERERANKHMGIGA